MRRLSKRSFVVMHLAAMLVAALLVFGLRIQDYDLRRLGVTDLGTYTPIHSPYMRGINRLDQHDLYAPEFADTRKLVLFGASTVESLVCDTVLSNAHYNCSIARHLNDAMREARLADWHAFSLARAGSRMTDTLYLAARIQDLKPEIIVMGDVFGYASYDNGNSDQLGPAEYDFLDTLFAAPDTAAIWASYKQVIRDKGWVPGQVNESAPITLIHDRPITGRGDPLTVNSLLSYWIPAARLAYSHHEIAGPIRLDTHLIRTSDAWKNWGAAAPGYSFVDPDPGFRYYQALALIAALQKRHGGKFLFYASPEYANRHNTAYTTTVNALMGNYAAGHGFDYLSLISFELRAVTETYEGLHQTDTGNRRIAEALLAALQARYHLSGPPRP